MPYPVLVQARGAPAGGPDRHHQAAATSACVRSSPSVASAGARPQPHSVATPNRSTCALGRLDAAASALGAVLPVHEAEVQLRLVRQFEPLERLEVGVVVALDRHRQVQPLDRPGGCREQRVREADEIGGVGRLDEVLLARVAVTEVESDLHVERHATRLLRGAGGEARPGVAPPRLEGALAARGVGGLLDDLELDRDVPLDREVLVRDHVEDLIDLAEQRVAVDGLDRGALVSGKNAPTTATGVGSDTWKRTPSGTTPSSRRRRNTLVRLDSRSSVAEGGEIEWMPGRPHPRRGRRAHPDPSRGPGCRRALDALGLRQDVGLEQDPVEPRPDLAVGDALTLPPSTSAAVRIVVSASG